MSKMGATPLHLAIILVQANAYLRVNAMLRLSDIVSGTFLQIKIIRN